MEDLIFDILEYIKSLGLYNGLSTDMFIGFMPENPDDVLVLTEYKGAPGLMVDPAVHRSFKIVARSKDASKAFSNLKILYNKIFADRQEDGKMYFGERWGQVYLRETPFRYKTDINERHYYTFDISVTANY